MSQEGARPRGCDGAKLVTLIETDALIGRGTKEDPCRKIVQYWTLGGQFVAQVDEWANSVKECTVVDQG